MASIPTHSVLEGPMADTSQAEVARIFQAMLEHRQRVVRQVAGVPAAAMRAAISEGHVILESVPPEPDDKPPEEAGFVQWLEKKANAHFLTRAVFAMTPWGRNAQYQREQQQSQGEWARNRAKDSFYDHQEQLTEQALDLSEDEARFLSRQDAALLGVLAAQGHLLAVPEVRNEFLGRSDRSPDAMALPGANGRVTMRGDRKGDYYGTLPLRRHYNEARESDPKMVTMGSFGEYVADFVDKTKPPQGQGRANDRHQIYTRWAVLLHEVAHTRFAQEPAPFRPSGVDAVPSHATAVNRWMGNAFSMLPSKGRTMLNETHSDVLAAMLLLESTGHDPQAVKVLEDLASRRRDRREQADMINQETLAKNGSLGNSLAAVHVSEWGLEHALATRKQWAGMAPDALRDLALGYASDSLKTFVDPKRRLPNGEVLGTAYANALVPEAPDQALSTQLLWDLVVMSAHGANVPKELARAGLDPAAHRLLQDAWDTIGPRVQARLDEFVRVGGREPSTLRDEICKDEGFSSSAFTDLLNEPGLAINNPDSPDYQAMVRAYQRDRPLMLQGLGGPALAPKAAVDTAVDEIPPMSALALRRAGRQGSPEETPGMARGLPAMGR